MVAVADMVSLSLIGDCVKKFAVDARLRPSFSLGAS